MIPFFKSLLALAVLIFPIASMLGVGLTFSLRQIGEPLRNPSRVFRALVANFVLVPLLAVAIARALGLSPSVEAGLLLVGTAAGAPFLLKLSEAAGVDVALGAALLVLLVPLTIIFMPLVVPLVIPDAQVNAARIALPLVLTMLLPLGVGLVLHAAAPGVSERLRPIAQRTATLALITLIGSTVVVNARLFRELGPSAIAAAALLAAGSFGLGYLLSSSHFHRSAVMGLGAGQRNIAAAMVVASQDFDDPRTLVMVVLFSVVALLVLFLIAAVLRRRPTDEMPPRPAARPGGLTARAS